MFCENKGKIIIQWGFDTAVTYQTTPIEVTLPCAYTGNYSIGTTSNDWGLMTNCNEKNLTSFKLVGMTTSGNAWTANSQWITVGY